MHLFFKKKKKMKRKREKREAWQKLNIHRSWLYRRMFELYKHTRVYISVNKHGEIETARVSNAKRFTTDSIFIQRFID